MQRRFTRVRRPEERDLRSALGADHQRRATVSATLPGAFELFGEVLDARLDVSLKALGPLVFRDGAQHLTQPLEALARVARLAEGGLGRLVFGREIGGHDDNRSGKRLRRRVPFLSIATSGSTMAVDCAKKRIRTRERTGKHRT